MKTLCTLLGAAVVVTSWPLGAATVEVGPLLKTLQAVGPKGAGNREATRAWQQLARADARQLPVILAGLDDAGPLAANWIRAAVDTIAERQLQRGGGLPAAELEQFLLDTGHAPRARRLAYEWLRRVDPSAPKRLIPRMLDDPSLEIRRDAVAWRIDQAERLAKAENTQQAVAVYQQALTAARDLDQVKLLSGRLRRLGLSVDLCRHFGFVVRWKVIGPFDNTDGKGFDAPYPPEKEIELEASYDGKHGKVKWIDYLTPDEYGRVDLNKPLGEEKSVVGYALSRFVSERQREVELRLASYNALKLWLNGELIDQREVYHMGSEMDQYVSRVVLKPGENLILVKACQNAIMESWARHWGFQLRVCDQYGTAVLSSDRNQ